MKQNLHYTMLKSSKDSINPDNRVKYNGSYLTPLETDNNTDLLLRVINIDYDNILGSLKITKSDGSTKLIHGFMTSLKLDNLLKFNKKINKGKEGPPGEDGLDGRRGRQGSPGCPGVRGDQGLTGVRGDQGQIGDQGDQGDQGADGHMGPKGNKGFTGDQGPIGPRGFRGEDGPHGIIGLQGDPGVKGLKGVRGDQGCIGDQGLEGPKGMEGNQGPPGDVGDNGDGSRNKGIDGVPGPVKDIISSKSVTATWSGLDIILSAICISTTPPTTPPTISTTTTTPTPTTPPLVCKVAFSGGCMSPTPSSNVYYDIDGANVKNLTAGDYPDLFTTLSSINITTGTLDSIVIRPGVRLTLWDCKNFTGFKVIDAAGPLVICNTVCSTTSNSSEWIAKGFTADNIKKISDINTNVGPSANSIMHFWGENGSVKISCDGSDVTPIDSTDCTVAISRSAIDTNINYYTYYKITYGDAVKLLKVGEYPDLLAAIPNLANPYMASFFVSANTTFTVWSGKNYTGNKVLEVVGPAAIYSNVYKNTVTGLIQSTLPEKWISLGITNVKLVKEVSPVYGLENTYMTDWAKNGSAKITCGATTTTTTTTTTTVTTPTPTTTTAVTTPPPVMYVALSRSFMHGNPDPSRSQLLYWKNSASTAYPDHLTVGDYPDLKAVLIKLGTADLGSIVVPSGRKLTVWGAKNFAGSVVLELTGPFTLAATNNPEVYFRDSEWPGDEIPATNRKSMKQYFPDKTSTEANALLHDWGNNGSAKIQ